uniref:Uncharacterized protein n=1 Tax=Arundo donax TaxID=35708 RepID=A0A0A9C3Q7_ARUDO
MSPGALLIPLGGRLAAPMN